MRENRKLLSTLFIIILVAAITYCCIGSSILDVSAATVADVLIVEIKDECVLKPRNWSDDRLCEHAADKLNLDITDCVSCVINPIGQRWRDIIECECELNLTCDFEYVCDPTVLPCYTTMYPIMPPIW